MAVGARGAGKTALADWAARRAAERGFEVSRVAVVSSDQGLLVWAQLLRDIGAPDRLAAGLMTDPSALDLDDVARQLVSTQPRLIIVDDVDRGGSDALRMLSVVGGRCPGGATVVLATSKTSAGFGSELWLGGLTAPDIGELVGGTEEQVWAVQVASAGLPGIALTLAHGVRSSTDPIVWLALRTASRIEFLDVDVALVRLLELAASRAPDDGTRARVLARLARSLLGDASTGARRESLIRESLALARESGDARTLAEVLDASLHAVWDPAGAVNRLDTGAQIVELARSAGDDALERQGLFWRFIALMELGRVGEAESVLAGYTRAATAAGDEVALVTARGREAVLAALRGRFDDTMRIADEVAELGRIAGVADTERVTSSIRSMVWTERGDAAALAAGSALLQGIARRLPGHFYEADHARLLVFTGRLVEAQTELERALPQVLAGSGPRWIPAATQLALAAVTTGQREAMRQLETALLPYHDRLVVWAGANNAWLPVAHFLGLLAHRQGRPDDARRWLETALEMERRNGAVPSTAHTLAALAEVTADPGEAAEFLDQARSIAERLGMPRLLDTLRPPADEWRLHRDGEHWVLHAGEEQARLPDIRGMAYLRALVAVPGREIAALDLVAGGAGLVSPSAAPVLDDAARQAYRIRLAQLDTRLADADDAGDQELGTRLQDERDQLLDELRTGTGLGGRARRTGGEGERARVNVTRTIRTAIAHIEKSAPRAAAHLRSAIRTGSECRYQPQPGGPARWQV